MNTNTKQQESIRKIINLPMDVKKALSIQAINANMNLKNYIEMVCIQLSKHGEYCVPATDSPARTDMQET